MQELRVYEFAKEIGIETIALMDKLRGWDISVKSHMATLDGETLELIRAKMNEEDSAAAAKQTKKKTAAKKKTKAKKASSTTTKKKTVRKKKATKSADSSEPTKKVIRRKAGQKKEVEPVVAEKEVTMESPIVETKSEVSTLEASPVAPVEAVAEKVAEVKEVKEKIAVRKPKNIVGKIDLAKVEAYAKTKYTKKDSNSGIRSTTGVSRRPGVMMDEPPQPMLDSGKKEKGRKKLARNTGPSEDTIRGPSEEVVAGFNRTDFRKREAIFQPKKKRAAGIGENKKTEITKPKASKRIIKVSGDMSVADVAKELKLKPGQLVGHLMKQGMSVRMTDMIDFDTIALIAPEFEYEAQDERKSIEDMVEEAAYGKMDAELVARPPVVTVMGHVDHGKTSLLDVIRKADVASGEAGGITQHIGAYQVQLEDKKVVTFLDTPGHEAFTAMRARGANVTDVAVIVIAADDGVMPQTAEAINHAKAAGVPIIVAVNKMDRPNANMDKIKQQVMEFELVPEEWGGTTMFIGTSATEKQGITELIEAIHLQAELLEIKANPQRSATGLVIESKMVKGRGIVATLLVKDGTLKKGDEIVAGSAYGRVRALLDDKGKAIKTAGPGTPVEILGLNESPMAGDTFDSCKDEKQARSIAQERAEKKKAEANIQPSSKMSLEELFSKVQEGETKELPVVLKTDVAGSAEAIRVLFEKVSTPKVSVKIIHTAVGGITESDVLLASSANAILVGFNVRPDNGAQASAKKEGVQVKSYSIIYELGDDIRNAMRGLLAPKIVEQEEGFVEVRELFKVPSVGTIAGCFVTKGKVHRSDFVRLVRDGTQVYEGEMGDLRRFKDSVKEVAEGYECGIRIENFNDIKVGDVIETYSKKEVEAELE